MSATPIPEYPVYIEDTMPNLRLPSRGSTSKMGLALAGSAEHQQMRDQVWGVSGGGAWPVVLIPADTDPDVAINGRIEETASSLDPTM